MKIQIWKNAQSCFGKVKILNKTYNLRFGNVPIAQAKKLGDNLIKELMQKYGKVLQSPVDAFQDQIDDVVADVGKQLGEKPGKSKPATNDKPAKKKRGPRGPYKKGKKDQKSVDKKKEDAKPTEGDNVKPLDRKRGLLDSISKEFNDKIKRIKSTVTVTDTEIEYSTEIATALKNHFNIGTSPENASVFWKWVSGQVGVAWKDFKICTMSILKDVVNDFLKAIK